MQIRCLGMHNVGLYLTTSTGQWAWFTTPEDTLPIRSFLNPVRPLVPITIRSTFRVLARFNMASTIENVFSKIALSAFTCAALAWLTILSTVVFADSWAAAV